MEDEDDGELEDVPRELYDDSGPEILGKESTVEEVRSIMDLFDEPDGDEKVKQALIARWQKMREEKQKVN